MERIPLSANTVEPYGGHVLRTTEEKYNMSPYCSCVVIKEHSAVLLFFWGGASIDLALGGIHYLCETPDGLGNVTIASIGHSGEQKMGEISILAELSL